MKAIKNFEDYFVDTDGNVYSNKKGYLHKLRTHLNQCGYQTVSLRKNKKPKWITVHKLVASSFIRELDVSKDETVNHKDGNKLNNKLDNLEIITRGDNVRHSRLTGLQPCKFSRDIITSALLDIKNGLSVNKTAKKYNISQSYLNKIKNGKYRKNINVESGFND